MVSKLLVQSSKYKAPSSKFKHHLPFTIHSHLPFAIYHLLFTPHHDAAQFHSNAPAVPGVKTAAPGHTTFFSVGRLLRTILRRCSCGRQGTPDNSYSAP